MAVRLALLAIVGLIIMNPVRVDETPGVTELPKVMYLLDASQSMAIGKGTTRWDQVVEILSSSRELLTRKRVPRPASSGSEAG